MTGKVNLNEKADALRRFIRRESRMPGYGEMLRVFGYCSKNAVFGLLLKLEEAGYIRKKNGKISPTDRLAGTIKLLGTVQAGFPTPAEEELLDTLTLDEFLIKRPEATFMLKVTGDSMIEAGIQPGDLLLVERNQRPRTHDIVVAEVDGEWTLKYFVRDRRGVRLEAANKKYGTIYPRETMKIGGIVRTVIRKYD
ncbi:MAG: transcriptional repressor LexA [Kiritimatiellia bacterium]